ncbi:MAG: LLM class flavin-dependent oxidoreductase, partial [Alphaproteobacteria bacterium]
GKYYRVKQAKQRPFPVQRPHPAIMSAGSSKAGQNFAAKYADVAFTSFYNHKPDDMRARGEVFRKLARDEYGRDIRVWTSAYIFQGETEAEARRIYNYCVHEKGDQVAVGNLLTTMGLYSQGLPVESLNFLKEHFIAGWGGYPLVGTKEQIVDGLKLLSDLGYDGILLSWAPYISGMAEFQAKTLPLLVQTGLR